MRTVEWLPGQPLGNDRQSWSDELIGELPNIYIYAVNNPSESILAKRRGYGSLISYNVPPYGRAGLYLELATLNELVNEYRLGSDKGKETSGTGKIELREPIWSTCYRSGLVNDVPLRTDTNDEASIVKSADLPQNITTEVFDSWVGELSIYLVELQDRLFSSGLHTLGTSPSNEELASYLQAYFGDRLTIEDALAIVSKWQESIEARKIEARNPLSSFLSWIKNLGQGSDETQAMPSSPSTEIVNASLHDDATRIVSLLVQSTEELDNIVNALDGGYIPALPGGDLLRDGPAVLPTGRNIHALDPYRMPSAGAWARGQLAAEEILRQHRQLNNGDYPQTVAVTLWGLDAIKTRGM
jgi:magnesium chelatase subunit H